MPKPRKTSPTSVKALRFSDRPGFLLLIIITTIFVSEFLVMVCLEYLTSPNIYTVAFIDAVLLSIIVSPILYMLAFRPLTNHIALHQKAEKEKNALIAELNEALAEVKTLQGIIPICSSCKKIRDDEGFWHQLEAYVSAHYDAEFSHGICNQCMKKLYPEEYEDVFKGE
jgi:hypothetical protein